jgi:hypothetical protein
MAEPNWFTGEVAGEDPRVAAARTAASPTSPFLTTLITALNTQQQYKNKRQGAVVGGALGFLQGLLSATNRDTAAALTTKDIASQEAFTSALGDRMTGEQQWMAQNGSPLDNERVQLRAQAFTGLVKLMQSPDPQVRQQALQQIGQISQQDAQHFSEIDNKTETQRQERYALRVKQGDEYKAQFNQLQTEQRQKESEFQEVASILADPKADLQAKRAAYFKYSQTSYGDAKGNATSFSAAPFGFGVSFDLLKDMTPEQMLAAAKDSYTARVGVLPSRLNDLVGSMQRDGFQFNSENGGVDDLNLLRDKYVRQQYQATGGPAAGTPGVADDAADIVTNATSGLLDTGPPGSEINASISSLKSWAHDYFHRAPRPTNE